MSSVEDNTQKAYEYYQRGLVHYANNAYQEAYNAFKQALASANNPHQCMCLFDLSVVSRDLGFYDESSQLEHTLLASFEAVALRRLVIIRLEQLGFYKDIPPSQLTTIQTQAIQSARLFDNVPNRVLGCPDFEGINEGDARSFLLEALPILAHYGFRVAEIEETSAPGDEHAITLDGVRHVLYSPSTSDEATELPFSNFLKLLDKLLAEVQVDERVYLTGDLDHDPKLVVLTPAVQEVLEQTVCFLDWFVMPSHELRAGVSLWQQMLASNRI